MGWGSKVALLAFAFVGMGSLVYFLYKKEKAGGNERRMNLKSSKCRRLEMKVPKQSVSFVIGRGGSKLKEIESLTDTKIHFKTGNSSAEHEVCVVLGANESVHLAEELIHDIIVNQPLIEVSHMHVPQQALSRIMGKNGENIRSISQCSNVKITVEHESLSKDQYQRKITLKGTAEQIECAKLLIEEKVEEDNQFRSMVRSGSASRSPRHKTKYMLAGAEESAGKEKVDHRESLVATGSDGMLEVYISALNDPEKFWVQVVGPSTIALDILNEQMTDYYCKEENRALHVLKEVAVEQIVAAPFWNDNKWYRAEVTDMKVNEYDLNESELSLYYVDYGDSTECKKKEVYELRADFLKLRFQAIECILAKVIPRGSWTEESIDLFESLTYTGAWKSMTARVDGYRERPTLAKKEGSPVPCVELYDSQGSGTTINVADEMVKKGFADWIEDTKEGSSKASGEKEKKEKEKKEKEKKEKEKKEKEKKEKERREKGKKY